MSRDTFRLVALKLLMTLMFLFLIQIFAKAQKINGIAFSAPYEEMLHDTMFEQIKVTNANWVGLVPEALLDRSTLLLLPDEENGYKGATVETIEEGIQLARKAGFSIFLKPHIILKSHDGKSKDKTRRASWRGDVVPRSDEDWLVLESCYEEYILELADLAEEYDVELFAIGTELKSFVQHRPGYWDKLISKWRSIKKKIKRLSEETDRQVLFTEYGYRNVSFAGRKPWIHDGGQKKVPNNEAQANLLEALLGSFWEEDWIAGGFSWEWFGIPLKEGNTDFTIQNKPALGVLQEWYGK